MRGIQRVGGMAKISAPGNEKGAGKPLLEVIRPLTEMDPDERTALVGLLRAFG